MRPPMTAGPMLRNRRFFRAVSDTDCAMVPDSKRAPIAEIRADLARFMARSRWVIVLHRPIVIGAGPCTGSGRWGKGYISMGMSISRRDTLGLLAAAPFVQTMRRDSRRTNVVMFMTDDHGAWATGAYGCSDLHTPVIDRLAATGVRFRNAFACTPVCSPSRMTYMTGELPSHHGVQDWLIPEDSFGPTSRRWLEGHTAYSEILARNGYHVGLCGKWHMGEDDKAQAGFEYWASVPGGSGPYRKPEF